MNIKKQTIQGVFWSAIQNWGSQAGSLIVFLILARLLTPEAFGLVALANIFINFVQIFLDQGFDQALIQREDIEEKHINTAFWTQVLLSFLLTAISFLAAPLIAQSFNQSRLIPVVRSLSIIFIISAFSQTQRTLLKRKFAFQAMAMRTLLGITIAGFVGILMASQGYGVWSLVGQQLTYETMGIIVLWKVNDWRPKFQFSWQHLSDIVSFSLGLFSFRLMTFFNQKTDNLLVGYFLGEVALGYYAISHRILQVMTQLLVGTLNQVALPAFSRLQNDSEKFTNAYYRATQLTSLVAFPVFLGTLILSSELVITLFGEKWISTVLILQILSLTGILQTITILQGSAFIALGQPWIRFRIGLLNASFNLVACLVGVQWGLQGVAAGYVISGYLLFPISQWFLNQLTPISIKDYLSQLLAPCVCTTTMIIALIITRQGLLTDFNPQSILMISTPIGIIVYSLTLALLFPALFREVLSLVRFLQPLTKK